MGAATSEHKSTEQMQDKGYSLAGSGSPDGSKRKHPARNTVANDEGPGACSACTTLRPNSGPSSHTTLFPPIQPCSQKAQALFFLIHLMLYLHLARLCSVNWTLKHSRWWHSFRSRQLMKSSVLSSSPIVCSPSPSLPTNPPRSLLFVPLP